MREDLSYLRLTQTGIGRHKIGKLGMMPYKNSWNTPSPRAGVKLIDRNNGLDDHKVDVAKLYATKHCKTCPEQ